VRLLGWEQWAVCVDMHVCVYVMHVQVHARTSTTANTHEERTSWEPPVLHVVLEKLCHPAVC
jgi:hypothetical protein